MKRAVEMDSGNARAWADLAGGLFVLQQYEACLQIAQLGLQHTGSGRLHYFIGVCHLNFRRFEKSVEFLNLVAENDPNYPHAQSSLGVSFTHLHQYERALKHFHRAAALRPLTSDIQKILDQVDAHVKRLSQAR